MPSMDIPDKRFKLFVGGCGGKSTGPPQGQSELFKPVHLYKF